MARRLGTLLILGLTAAASSCSRESGPRWIRLADGFRPTAELQGDWEAPFQGDTSLSIAKADAEPNAFWIRAEISRDDWRPSEVFPDVWRVLRPIACVGAPPEEDPQRLEGGGRKFRYFPFSQSVLRAPRNVPEGSFCGFLDQLYLRLEPGATPPEHLVYSTYVRRGRARDGVWNVPLGAYHCDGIPVWSGGTEEVVVDVPPRSALRFTSIARASSAHGLTDARVTFTVRANGREVLRTEQAVTGIETLARHVVDLSDNAGSGVRLSFSTEGHAALAAFLEPVVGPLAIGRAGERPWSDDRPDLVLFLADTFRADNLSLYGGERGVTPSLDTLAERSLAFTRAWAPASWTLPSQASMMCGLMPYQHGAVASLTALPDEALTIAEVLEDAGYRTEAVTDAAFLSHRFAMDQGFQWFDELPEDKREVVAEDSLDVTLSRVDERLAADDGRPLFLWVQTYRVHWPYVVTERTREEYGDRLDLGIGWKDVMEALSASAWTTGSPVTDELQPVAAAMRELYLGGVVDFDRMFGDWVDRQEARGFFDHAVLLFTSDHGEAFGDHRDLYHGTGVWESQIRIPMLLFGAGVEPAEVSHAASLLDLPRTFAELAGTEPSPGWAGESLLRLDRDRPVFAFEVSTYETSAQAVIEGDRKLILPEDEAALRAGRIREAYDLKADPQESENLLERNPAWIGELCDRRLGELEVLRRRLLPETAVRLSVDDRDELERIGYASDED